MSQSVHEKIAETIQHQDVVLFVKGDRNFPQCGFSKAVMDIFTDLGVAYETVDVLADPEIRQGIKDFTNWPTIPQVFVKGEFIGGCDIVRDLYESGELKAMVGGSK